MAKPNTNTIVQVALPVPLRRTFSYRPPPHTPITELKAGTRVKVPFGNRQLIGIIHDVEATGDPPEHSLKTISQLLDPKPALDDRMVSLCRWAADYYHHPIGDVYQQAIPTLLRNQEGSWEKTSTRWQLTQKGRLIGLEQLTRAKRQLEALTLLREHPGGLHQPMLKGLGISQPTLKALTTRGLIEPHEEIALPADWYSKRILAEAPLTLNSEQAQALESIQQSQEFQVLLLEGVTGSGKTEVYLQAITQCLQRGQQALVLVPEIGLTPQTLHRFQQRFAVPVVSYHSHLSDQERLSSWAQAKAGGAAVVLGTRSALFAPLNNLGLIVIDEEHDQSYKQQEGFRFHARDVAIVRARQQQIPIVLGSATPALETLNNAVMGRYHHIKLTQRAGNAQQAQYRVLDIRQKSLTFGIAPELLQEIERHLQAKHQVLVFINRRGYAPVLMCHDCGWIKECPHCDHRMTCHAAPPHVHCHHCNYQQAVPKACDHCKSTDLRPIGLGTERLEDNLGSLFPDTPVIRIDRDTTQRKTAMKSHLAKINSGVPCILVGTQMLAKGHHFPKVTLVAICDIDSGFFAADFRAIEHTAQLLVQVSGRAGRGEKQGLVMLQTHQPQHPLLFSLLNDGYPAFAKELLAERQLMAMPPFSYLALLRAESLAPQAAAQFLEQLAHWIEPLAQSLGVDVWGPAPALMPKKARRFRFQLMLKADTRPRLHQALQSLIQEAEQIASHRIRWNLDIDPVTLD